MKRKSRRLLLGLMALVVAMTVVVVPQTETANADYVKVVNYKKTMVLSTYDDFVVMYMGKNKVNKSTKVYSSKPSVARLTYDDGDVAIHVRKPGTTRLVVKTGKAKYTCKLRVVKKQNPFKKYYIGRKNFGPRFNKDIFASLHKTADKARINIVPKKNWQVKKIHLEARYYNYKTGKSAYYEKIYKNRQVMKFFKGKNWDYRITVTMHNKKTKLTEDFYMRF